MKKWLSFALVLVMVFSLTAVGNAEVSGDPILIGLTTVLTGDRSLEGEYASNVCEIFMDEVNSAGGILGRPVKVVIEDAQGTDVGATTAWRKLASNDDIVAIIGADSSNDNIAVADLVKENQIITIAQGSSPTLRDLCYENPWLFQIRACDATLCYALMDFAVTQKGFTKFAVINEQESAGVDQANLFRAALATHNIEPVISLSFATGTKDMTALLMQIQQSGAEAIVGSGFPDGAAMLLQQKMSLGMDNVVVFGSNGYADPMTLRLAGEAANGVYSTTHWSPDTTSPKGSALAAKYKELYKEDCGKSASQVYDALSVICEGIKRAGTTDRAAVRDALNTIDAFEGVMTTYDVTTNGDCGRGGLLVEIQDGVAVIVEQIEATEKSGNPHP